MTTPQTEVEIPLEKTNGLSLWLPRLALVAGLAMAGPFLALILEFLPYPWAGENPILLGLILTAFGAAFLTAIFFGARAIVVSNRTSLLLAGDTLQVVRGAKKKPLATADLRDVQIACQNHRYRTSGAISPVLTIDLPGYEEIRITVNDDQEHPTWRRDLPETEEPPSYNLGTVAWRRLLRALRIDLCPPPTGRPANP